MAGLPKAALVLLTTIGIIGALALVGVAEDLQTGSVVLPPAPVQTPSNVLQPAFDLIDGNANADPADQQALKDSFQAAFDLALLTVDQALNMLGIAQWETLTDPIALASTAVSIQSILADLIAGTLAVDPVTALQQLLNMLATPAGTLNAIGKAGASDEILNQVSSLVAGGVPPGIVVRLTKEGLRNGLSEEAISAILDELAEVIASGVEISWGQVANMISDKGNEKHQDQEQNANVEGNEEPEEEENSHGNSGSNSNNGNGNGKDKKDKGSK